MRRLLVFLVLILPMVSAYNFCSDGEVGGNITVVSVSDELRDNDDEWVWGWGDSVEVEVEVASGFVDEEDFMMKLVFVDADEDRVYVAVDEGDLAVDFSVEGNSSETISFVFVVDDDVLEMTYDVYLKVYKDNDEDEECVEDSWEIEVGGLGLCSEGSVGSSYLEVDDVTDENLDNSEDWVWSVGDEVEVSLVVQNKKFGDLDLDVELIFVDEDGDEVDLAVDESDLVDNVDVDEDEEEDMSFIFEVDDLDEGEYSLYAVATDVDNDSICFYVLASEDVEIKSDLGVIVSDVSGLSNVEAGSTVSYVVEVTNEGSSDEEQVIVYVYNTNLGVDEDYVVYDLGVGEVANVTIDVYFPDDSAGAGDRLLFTVEYDYDEDLGVYMSAYDDSTSYTKKFFVEVYGDLDVDDEELNESVEIDEDEDDLDIDEDSDSLVGPVFSSAWLKYVVIGGLVVLWLIVVLVLYLFFHKKK